MAWPPRTVRARLTLWYSVMLCLPLVAFAVLSYLAFSRTLAGRIDGFLHDALTAFENELRAERRHIPGLDQAIRTTVREVRFRDLDILVIGPEGELVAASRPPAIPSGAPGLGTDSLFTLLMEELGEAVAPEWSSTLSTGGGGYRVGAHAVTIGRATYKVAGIYPLTEVEETLQRIQRLFAVAIPLMILLAGIGGWFLARRSFRPLSAMAARAREISASNLYERLPVVVDDELGALARVMNDLLDRLERSFEQQRRFVADASHELRSPTAIVRAEADITLSREHREEEEYRASVAIIQGAARRLTRVVDDLFLLARVDGGQPVMHPTTLYLEEVVLDTVRVAGSLAEQKGVEIEVSGGMEAPFHGDPDLLGRLLLNLLDNAVKHTPRGGSVHVGMAVGGDSYEIRVVDDGPGIAPEAQARIFERFYQVDSSRTRTEGTLTAGAGLGLAIGRSIAEMHGGRLELAESRVGRTEFLLRLPVNGGKKLAGSPPEEGPDQA